MASRGRLLSYFGLAFVLFSALFLRFPLLWDSDSYYHLAVARLYGTAGPFAAIPWARFSMLRMGGDKEFLFHLILIPFAKWPHAEIGGRIALAMFNAALATTVAAIAVRAVGAIGYAIPLWLWLAASPFFVRAIRLRPELLALLVILLAIPAADRRSPRSLALLAFAFTLGYTAFHVFLALCGLWWLWDWYERKRPDWTLIGAPVAGVLLGLLARPHPVENLRIWYVQNVAFFFNMRRLEVGDEILPPHLGRIALVCAAWIAGMVLLWFVRDRERPRDPAAPLALIATAVFAILFLRFARMATYLFPLATLAILLVAGRPRRAGRWILLGTGLVALPLAADPTLIRLLAGNVTSEREWAAFGRAVPPGAKVAADWGSGELYAFWAPQGRYLNVLDPIFMYLPYRREFAAQWRVFHGLEPDLALTTKRTLDSDYLAFDRTSAPELLLARLRDDPRFEVVYGGYDVLLRVKPSDSFLTQWAPLPPQSDPYAGFVDATPLARGGCADLSHDETFASPQQLTFAAWGPARLTIDGRVVAETERAQVPHFGTAPIALPAGAHHFEVRACTGGGVAGFYLKR